MASDICKALGIVWKGSDSIGTLAEIDEDKKGASLTETVGGKQEVIVVSEGGQPGRRQCAPALRYLPFGFPLA